jgi:acyl-CoA dehydrogenase
VTAGQESSTAFILTPAQRSLVREVRELAGTQLRPAADAGEPGRVDRELIATMGRLGLLQRLFPGHPGPGDAPAVAALDLCLMWEALATETLSAGLVLALQGLGAFPVAQHGREEQIRRWLPAVSAGSAVPAFAFTEPGTTAGPGVPAVGLAAEPDGEGWRLTGEKTWVYNAPEADFYTVFARTEPGDTRAGVSAFLVPAIRPGLSGEPLDIVSGCPVGSLTFDEVPVCPDDLIGEQGQGLPIAVRTQTAFRPVSAALAVGMAQAALDVAVAEIRARGGQDGTAGKRLSEAPLLTEMATSTEAARLLTYAAAAAYDATGHAARQSAMAVLHATDTAQFVVDGAMQLLGRETLRRGHLLAQLYHAVRASRLHQGIPEAVYGLIAGELTQAGPAWAAAAGQAGAA